MIGKTGRRKFFHLFSLLKHAIEVNGLKNDFLIMFASFSWLF